MRSSRLHQYRRRSLRRAFASSALACGRHRRKRLAMHAVDGLVEERAVIEEDHDDRHRRRPTHALVHALARATPGSAATAWPR